MKAKSFIKGAIIGFLIYVGFNVISLLIALPILLGYFYAIVFTLTGGFLYYLIQERKKR